MSMDSLIAFNTAVAKIKQSQMDIQNINLARTSLEQKQQQLDINQKESDAKIEGLGLSNQHTALENKNLQDAMDNHFGSLQDQIDGQNAMIDHQEQNTVDDARQAHTVAGQLFNTDPDVRSYATGTTGADPNAAAGGEAPAGGGGSGAITVPGPDGGMVMGQDASNSPQSDQTPNAVASLFGNLPQVGSMKPYMTGTGDVGMKNITSSDNEGMMLQRLQQAKAQGIPLNADETAFYNKQMGIKDNTNTFNADASAALAGKTKWSDLLSKYPDQAKKISDIKFASEQMNDNDGGAATPTGGGARGAQAPGNGAEASGGTGQVQIKGQDGQIWSIPSANLPQALKRGAVQIGQ